VSQHRTYCRICSAACGLVIEVEDNKIVTVRGDRDHPVSGGYLCIKALSSADWQNGEDRLIQTLRRQPDGTLGATDPEQALDEIHLRISRILDQYGPRAVALYYGTGAKNNSLGAMALAAWLRAVGSPYLYSSSTLDQSAKWVTRSRMGFFASGRHAIRDVDVMLVVGCNPNISHSGFPLHPFPSTNVPRWVREARARGAKLIVVDPRRTEFARQADLHLPVIPGEDVSLLAGMINVILANGWENHKFCERFVGNLTVLRQEVQAFTSDYAAQRSGVPEADLIEAARLFATAERASASSGTGPNMSARSNLAEHLVEALNAICGAYRRAGDPVRNMGVFSPRPPVVEGVVPPARTWEQGPKLWTEHTGLIGGEFPASRLPNEILHGGLRALFVVGGNPVTALGQADKTLEAFRKLDLLVTIDPRLTETAQLADYVFPCTLPYERHDATHYFDSFFIEPFAQMAAPMLRPPEGVLEDWEIFWGLAKRAGLQLVFQERKWGGVGGAAYEIDMRHKPTSEELMRLICDVGDMSYDEFLRQPQGIKYEREPSFVEPAGEDDGARLDVCPNDVAAELRGARREDEPTPFRYRLAVRRMMETMNGAYRDAERTRRRWPRNPAFMNPVDMNHEGLAPGDAVRIESEAGEIVAEVRADDRLRQGVISMSHQWGRLVGKDDVDGTEGGFTGRLVSLDTHLETINYMPRQSGVPVNIRATGDAFSDEV
jgi:anaerobic selenocysteine-containing dehydrogenase